MRNALTRMVPTTADVTLHLVLHHAFVVTLSEHAIEWLVLDLPHRIPARDFDRADGDRTLGVSARLLALHHAREDFRRVEVCARVVDERCGIRLENARNESRPHLLAASITSRGVECITDDRLPAAHDVGYDCDDGRGHLAEVERSVAHVRLERNGDLADV